ncbi:unnamed protein product [Lymnaea stagnalis]|uniref:SAM domain-containing protein n=1 Tax=Lymnaea stagnalis TaxID=6523 RepID=A0AAV2IL09_LYMST
MAFCGNHFKPVYQSDNVPASGMTLYEPPFSVPVCYAWDANSIDNWLVDTGYGRYRPIFRQQNINGVSLLSLRPDDLRKWGVIDADDAHGILRNIARLRQTSRHMEPHELPGVTYTYYRSLYFGDQPPVSTQDQMSYSTWSVPDNATLRRIQSLSGGDTYGWFQRNRPHPTI